MSSDESMPKEKTRICPSCRMQISVLAVKCRFCGEEVGKPKEEQRSLSISDLGGETVHHRAPSGSVMEALETFRMEEDVARGADLSDLGGTSPTDPLAAFQIEEAAFGRTARQEQETSRARQAQKAKRTRLIQIAAGVVVLAAAAVTVPLVMRNVQEKDAGAMTPVFVNAAPGALEEGRYIEALELAVNGVKQSDTPDNRRILDEVITAIAGEVRGKLALRSNWSTQALREAVAMAQRAAEIHPTDVTENLRTEAVAEDRAYNVMLVAIEDGKAVFEDPRARDGQMRAGPGETFYNGRFEVVALIGNSAVRIEDTAQSGRRLRVSMQGTPTSN